MKHGFQTGSWHNAQVSVMFKQHCFPAGASSPSSSNGSLLPAGGGEAIPPPRVNDIPLDPLSKENLSLMKLHMKAKRLNAEEHGTGALVGLRYRAHSPPSGAVNYCKLLPGCDLISSIMSIATTCYQLNRNFIV